MKFNVGDRVAISEGYNDPHFTGRQGVVKALPEDDTGFIPVVMDKDTHMAGLEYWLFFEHELDHVQLMLPLEETTTTVANG